MRVTNRMMASNIISNINANSSRIRDYQNQMSSAKRINRPSDDPVGTARLLNTKAAIKEQEQYGANIENAISWLDNADSTLDSATSILQRCRELAVAGSTATTTEEGRVAMANEVNQLIEELVQLGNNEYAGRYVFGGGKSGQTPFTVASQVNGRVETVQFVSPGYDASLLDATYQQKVQIAEGVTINIAAGQKFFHTGTDGSVSVNGVFNELIELRRNLDAGDQTALGGQLDSLDRLTDNLLAERAVLGAKTNRLETALDRAEAYQNQLSDLESRLEDTDYAEASIGLSTQQTVYEATLAVSAKIMQANLIDFLK